VLTTTVATPVASAERSRARIILDMFGEDFGKG
jgi:hypothetical protein